MNDTSYISSLTISICGNPNVGKSTIFNALTGLNQHTGNWAGKTVDNAKGNFSYKNKNYTIYDLPGCYSLMAHSQEEKIARDFLCFNSTDVTIVVCDATCLERNLNLVLQTLEITPNVILCVNLLDEAKKKDIKIDLSKLSNILQIPVVGTSARDKSTLHDLYEALDKFSRRPITDTYKITYEEYIEKSITSIEKALSSIGVDNINTRFLALRLIDCDAALYKSIEQDLGINMSGFVALNQVIEKTNFKSICDDIINAVVKEAETISSKVIRTTHDEYNSKDRRLDRVLNNKYFAFPIMFAFLLFIFWITISFANYPSQLLSTWLFSFENPIYDALSYINCPEYLCQMLVFGVYRVLCWVVSVMLPPMAIFFPMFTLLEDVGYLPRIAFNLDKCFQRCNACGKQALTMCMGFGCNAVGVTGCRIIDSPRERLIAILTNTFVPCNGRFPMIIAIISMFMIAGNGFVNGSFQSAFILCVVIVFSVIATLLVSKILSVTLLKGVPSSFTLELPPYRKPQFAKVVVRSILDRTLFVLGRAVSVAIPAGFIIWICANTYMGDTSVLNYISGVLDPFGHFLGLDGVIILAFILGFPANEIIMPIIIMAYMSQNSLLEISDLMLLRQLLLDNGWTMITAISMILFSLMHFPCSTTLLTIQKETKSFKWTILSFLVPTLCGIIVCAVFANVARLFA